MEENINGELTFKKIWQQIKKSGVRIIVYGLVALIVFGGILGICDIFVSQSQYETRITYYYSGIEQGEDPWGGQNDVVADIKSAGNVSAALDNLKYTEEEKDSLINLIIRNLNVMTTTSNEVTSESGVVVSADYSYRIVLSQDPDIDKLLKSRNDYNNILNAITTNHIENFKKKYSFGTSLGTLGAFDSYNAFQKYDTVKGYLDILSTECDTWTEKASSFVSTSQDMSFASLKARLQVVLQKADTYLNHVLLNGINASGESDYVALKLTEANNSIAIYEEEIKTLNEVLALITQNGEVNVPSTGTIIINPADPTTVTDAINVAIANKTVAQNQKNSWETRQSYFNDQNNFESKSEEEKQTLVAKANALILEAINEYNDLIGIYKQMIEEYNTGYNVNSLVRMSAVPTQRTTSPITVKVGLIVEIVVLILAVMVAMIVTSKKGAMVVRKKHENTEAQEMVLIENAKHGNSNVEAQDIDAHGIDPQDIDAQEVDAQSQNVEPQGLPAQGLEEPKQNDEM